MRHFARQLEPVSGGQLQFQSQDLAGSSVAHGIHVAPALGEITDARGVVSTPAVPHGVERNLPPFSTPPLAHFRRS